MTKSFRSRWLVVIVTGLFVAATIHAAEPALPVKRGINLWLRADAGVTTNESGRVSLWMDQSGGSCGASQDKEDKQPQLIGKELNNRSVIHFDGVANSLTLGSELNTEDAIPFTFLAAIANAKSWNGLFDSRPLRPNLFRFYGGIAFGTGPFFPVASQESGSIVTARALREKGERRCEVWMNGRSVEPAEPVGPVEPENNSLPIVFENAVIGSNNHTEVYFRDDIAEILFYRVSLSEEERKKVEDYLGKKYDLEVLH